MLVVCLPRTPLTLGLVDERVIAQLPRGALVVDVGRGGVVDEVALRAALERGDVGGVALDVFEEEPLPASSPWWTAPNTIVTPHVAGYGLRYEARAPSTCCSRTCAASRPARKLLHRVDRVSGY